MNRSWSNVLSQMQNDRLRIHRLGMPWCSILIDESAASLPYDREVCGSDEQINNEFVRSIRILIAYGMLSNE